MPRLAAAEQEGVAMEPKTGSAKSEHPYIRSDRVEGTDVYGADRNRIGKIKYLEIEKKSGRIVYAITSFNSLFVVGANTHTIPWDRLKYDPRLHGYITGITKEELHEAPELSRGNEFDWSEQERERLDKYWSSIPYGWI